MEIRNWQQKIIDEFPSIVEENRRFILKAPTGAGKTFLASCVGHRTLLAISQTAARGRGETAIGGSKRKEFQGKRFFFAV